MLHTGDGAAKNTAQALVWIQKAAAQGQADAQYNLGAWYYNGDGLAKDTKKAHYWLKKSAAQGNAEAIAALAAIDKP
jgi:uncharacterized protein